MTRAADPAAATWAADTGRVTQAADAGAGPDADAGAGAGPAPHGVAAPPPLSWHRARALAHRLAAPLPAETVPLSAAAGRTLAAGVRAGTALPACDNAAMDGFAVAGAGPWRLVGRVLAGEPPAVALAPGTAVEVATGAPVPAGTARVVPYEAARRVGDALDAPPGGRAHVRRAGEYLAAGAEVLPAGGPLPPPALGLAAAAGADVVAVRRRARVCVLVTGAEVAAAGVPPPWGVRDAVGPVLAALLPAWGAAAEPTRYLADAAPAALAAAVAAGPADVAVVCGATSAGPTDHLRPALAALGAAVHVAGVACRPGHPQILAATGPRWVVGLPGNPYAALVAAWTLLHPLLTGLAGRDLPTLPRAPLAGPAPEDGPATRIVPVRRDGHAVRTVPGAAPGHLGAAAAADALAVLPPGWREDGYVELLACGSG